MNMQKIILFIDDENRGMDSYYQELKLEFKNKYEIKFINDLDEANQFLEKNHENIQLIILDVMMPPGKIFKDSDTDDGLKTGIRFYKKIRQNFPELFTVMFTNYFNKELENTINTNEKSCFFHKEDYLPYELTDEIKKILDCK